MLHLSLFSFFNGLESKGTNLGSRPRRSIGGEKNRRRMYAAEIIAVAFIALFCRKFVELFMEDIYNSLKNKFSRKKNNLKVIKVKKLSLKKRKSGLEVEIVEIDFDPLE